MIDFGLASYFRDRETFEHIAFGETQRVTGTARYASVNALRGFTQSPRDDLESLAYIFIYFLKGALPWQGLPGLDQRDRIRKICEVKQNIDPQTLCGGIPCEFARFLTAVRSLEFSETPNYALYRQWFRDLFMQNAFLYDFRYDWVEIAEFRLGIDRRNSHGKLSSQVRHSLQRKDGPTRSAKSWAPWAPGNGMPKLAFSPPKSPR